MFYSVSILGHTYFKLVGNLECVHSVAPCPVPGTDIRFTLAGNPECVYSVAPCPVPGTDIRFTLVGNPEYVFFYL
jgi:hypothetical protein